MLVVRIENPTVARDRLHSMSQDREENVRAFGAATCQYRLTVEENVRSRYQARHLGRTQPTTDNREPTLNRRRSRRCRYLSWNSVNAASSQADATSVERPDTGKTQHSLHGAPSARHSGTSAATVARRITQKLFVSQSPPPTENAVFDQVCSASTHGANKHHTLDHHIKRQSLPQPTRRLVVKLLPERPRRAVIQH